MSVLITGYLCLCAGFCIGMALAAVLAAPSLSDAEDSGERRINPPRWRP
jgi:hypothetical protein